MNFNDNFFLALFVHLLSYSYVLSIVTEADIKNDMAFNWNSAGMLEDDTKNELDSQNPNQCIKTLMQTFFVGIGNTIPNLSHLCYDAANKIDKTANRYLATKGNELFDTIVNGLRTGTNYIKGDWLIVDTYRQTLKKIIITYFKGIQYCQVKNDLFKDRMISLYKDIMEMERIDEMEKTLANEKILNERPALPRYQQESIPISARNQAYSRTFTTNCYVAPTNGLVLKIIEDPFFPNQTGRILDF